MDSADGHGIAMDGRPAPRPSRIRIEGAYVTVVPLDPAHADVLWQATSGADNDAPWLCMPYGPFSARSAFDAHLAALAASEDPLYYAILDRQSGRVAGHTSLLCIEPKHRAIEVGGIVYIPPFQRKRGATEAMHLLARYIFEDLGYRRYEWKCNALNEPSRRAALRLGFAFEGIFRQHMIVKGRNRDTAWFSILDHEWPERKRAFECWLNVSNFDAGGCQRIPLTRARIPGHSAGIHR